MSRKININITDHVNLGRQKTNIMSDYIGDLDDLNPSVNTSLVDTLNHIHDSIGGPIITTTTAVTLKGSINELDSDIGLNPATNLLTDLGTLTGGINELHTELYTSGATFTGLSANNFTAGIEEVTAELGDVTTLGTTNKASAVVAINELETSVRGTSSDYNLLTTSDNLVGATNELHGYIFTSGLSLSGPASNNVVDALDELHTELYTSGASFTGLSANNFTAGIEEVTAELGDVTTLGTTDKTSAVVAINELETAVRGTGSNYSLSTTNNNLIDATNELHGYIFTTGLSLTGLDADNAVDALNELRADIGDVTNLNTTASTAVAAINEHETDIGSINTNIGTLSSLTTSAKGNTVAAINELDAELGTISSAAMGTTASTVSGAILELETEIDTLNTYVEPTQSLNTTASTVGDAVNELKTAIDALSGGAGGSVSDVFTQIGDVNDIDVGSHTNLVDAINAVHDLVDTDLDFRSKFSASDTGGDGSFSYSSATGTFTYTGPSAANTRAHFAASTSGSGYGGLTYSNGTYTYAKVSDANIRGAVSASDAGGDGSFGYNSSTGVFTYTGPSAAETRAHLSAGGDLSYNSSTGQFSIDVSAKLTQTEFETKLDTSLNNNYRLDGTGLSWEVATNKLFLPSVAANVGGFGAKGSIPVIAVDAQGRVTAASTANNPYPSSLGWNSTTGVLTLGRNGADASLTATVDLDPFDTGDLDEGTNLYYTSSRATSAARAALSIGTEGSASGNGGISYNDGTGVFTYTPPYVSDQTITITAGTDLSGGGSFTLNRSTDHTITINHSDTSTQSSVNNSNQTVIQDITLDGRGHVTGIGSVDLNNSFVRNSGDDITGDLNFTNGNAINLGSPIHTKIFENGSDGVIKMVSGRLAVQNSGGTNIFLFDTNGDFHANADIIGYSASISDKRLKKDIVRVENAVEKVSKLNGYTFTYNKDDRKSAGVIAQEVEAVMPTAVTEKELMGEKDEVFKTVEHNQLHALYIEAIKELKAEIEDLKARLKDK